MAIPQDQLAQAFAQWQQANPNATDADMAMAMQQAGVSPYDLSIALGIDPEAGISRYNEAIAQEPVSYNTAIEQDPLSNPLTSNESSAGNPLLAAAGNTLGSSLVNPEFLTSTIGDRAVPGVVGGIMNLAAADSASERKNAALNTLISVIGGPAGTLFKAFLDQFGFFKGGRPEAVNLTPEQQIEEAYKIFQDQQLSQNSTDTEGQDARLMGMIADAEKIGLDTTQLRNQLKNQFGVTSIPGDLPEGYIKDSQGFIRDVATEGYWTIGNNGEPTKTTPPMMNVPMPNATDAASTASGGASAPSGGLDSTTGQIITGGSTPVDATGSVTGSVTGSATNTDSSAITTPSIDPTIAEHPWKYSNGQFTHVLTGEVKPAPPGVTYNEGENYSLGNYGANTSAQPSADWNGIFGAAGVEGVLAEMKRIGKSAEDVAKEANVSLADVKAQISDYVNSTLQGPAGKDGVNGKDGAAGINGKDGAIGPTGATGAAGVAGATGATGATGQQGVQGQAGERGEQGLMGQIGATGATGQAGRDGATGATGATGAAGTNGLNGINGINGINGATGATGATGAKGDTGQAGKTGLITSLVNATPIASQLFKPELFKAENKVAGLFDMVMRTRA